jgi:ATP-dependent DNA helicase 2 subunit 2
VATSSSKIKKLIAAADVKKGPPGRPTSITLLTFHVVPPKVKGKKGRQEVIKPLSGLDIESLLVKHKPQNISKENAIPEFRQILASADADEVVFEAVNDMAEIIRDLLRTIGDTGYQRAQENIKVMRNEMIDLEFPDTYNEFIRDLKKRISKKEFGNKTEFWQNLKHAKLGLIDTNTHPEADVSPEEAKEVCYPPLLLARVH